MAKAIPTTEPLVFVAGDAWKWDKSFGLFPASDGWQLSYYFRGESDYEALWGDDVTANGDGFEVRIPTADTGPLIPGPYRLYGRVTDGTDVHTPVELRTNVLADPTVAVNAKSFYQTQLDAIEAAIGGKALTPDQRRVRVNGREVEYWDHTELERWRAHYKLMVELRRNPHARLEHGARFVNP